MNDITSFMNWFLAEYAKMFGTCINTLDSITFWGFTLLDYLITIIIIGAMLTVLFTFAPSTVNLVDSREKSIANSREKKEREAERQKYMRGRRR